MLSHSIRSLSAAALALTGVAVLAPSAQAAKPDTGWRVTSQLTNPGPWLNGVAASDTRSAWVVGTTNQSSTPFSYHWNGTSWTAAGITVNQVDGLSTVSTSGPTNTWAFGYKTISIGNGVSRSVHWDGHTWVTADLPSVGPTQPQIISSVTLSAKDTWAFGGLRTSNAAPYIAHFTGKQWKQIAAPKTLKPGKITNAVALSKKDIWALVVEDQTYDLLHYDGRSWTIVKTPANFLSRGSGLVVRSKNDIWLAGARRTPNQSSQAGALRYNGKKWSFVPVATSAYALRSVTDDGQGGLWALTASPRSELWHDVKGHWSQVTLANIDGADLLRLSHIPGTSTTLGIGTDSSGPAVFVTGRF